MIYPIKPGSAVAVTIMGANSKIDTWTLALIYDDGYFKEYQYGFLSPDKVNFVTSCYSGGVTGCGINQDSSICKISDDKYKLITEDITEMNRIAEELRIKAEVAKEEAQTQRANKIEEINQLSEVFTISEAFPGLVVKRTTVKPNAVLKTSNMISVENNGKTVWINDFIMRNGKFQYRKFETNLRWLGFDEGVDVKILLPMMVNKYNEVRVMIDRIITK